MMLMPCDRLSLEPAKCIRIANVRRLSLISAHSLHCSIWCMIRLHNVCSDVVLIDCHSVCVIHIVSVIYTVFGETEKIPEQNRHLSSHVISLSDNVSSAAQCNELSICVG